MDPLPIEYASGDEQIHHSGSPADWTLRDFWSWAYSDCINNTTRGVLAEFLVAAALGIDLKRPRDGWAKFDLTYCDHGIEVKSASYHQRWFQKRLSRISYSIRKTRAWDEKTNTQDSEAKRQAFAYVLCLLAEKSRGRVDPLDIDQWRFWVVPTSFFDTRRRSQHSITYNSLVKEVGEPIEFDGIGPTLDRLISDS